MNAGYLDLSGFLAIAAITGGTLLASSALVCGASAALVAGVNEATHNEETRQPSSIATSSLLKPC
jgi:hypothetical protein